MNFEKEQANKILGRIVGTDGLLMEIFDSSDNKVNPTSTLTPQPAKDFINTEHPVDVRKIKREKYVYSSYAETPEYELNTFSRIVLTLLGIALLWGGAWLWLNYQRNSIVDLTDYKAKAELEANTRTVTRYETKSIEDICENDEVLATDPETGEVVKCRVTKVFKHLADGIHRVTIASGHSQQTFGVTAEHPYFVIPRHDKEAYWDDILNRAVSFVDSPEDEPETIFFMTDTDGNEHSGCYIAAKNLRNGDLLLGPSGELSQVIENYFEAHPEGIATYNFEVEHGHNYFVLAPQNMSTPGSSPVLVHNMCAKNSTNEKYTQHAEIRRSQGRPIGSAIHDARTVSPKRIYVQEDGSYLIHGSNGRIHIINQDTGKIITSRFGTASQVERKLHNGTITCATQEQIEKLRNLFK
ncbi:MAG: hypothetical protein LBJ67_00570 [Planctomycetaceae bacterium]|jgi:hypothetical protein|nr:hypothetical protein [Planctomycetaceae bacterium]